MKNRKLSLHKNVAKIAVATTVVIFSLLVCTVGTYAWFLTNTTFQSGASMFSASELDGEIKSISLIKFDYPTQIIGGNEEYDYLSPQRGAVHSYDYNTEENTFGYYENQQWVPVDVMNVYDPLMLEIMGQDLFEMNCNAIFKVVLGSSMFSTASLSCNAHLRTNVVAGANQILLSDCADFDLYLASDLTDAETFDGNPHQPSYYSSLEGSDALKDEYYRISYLASLPGETHAHFYGSATKPTDISLADSPQNPPEVTFDDGETTIYINVNYSVSQSARYSTHITEGENIRALYDYYLSFYFN